MPDDTPSKSASLTKSLGWFAASYLVSMAAYVVVNGLSARVLGPDSFGLFVVCSTAALVAAQLALVGTHRAGLRDAARVESTTDPRLVQLRDDFRAIERAAVPMAAGSVGVAAVVLAPGDAMDRALTAGALAGLVIVSAQQQLWSNALRGFGHIRLAGLIEGRSGGALVAVPQALLLSIVYVTGSADALPLVLAALCMGYLLPVALARRIVARRWAFAPPSAVAALARLRHIIRQNWRFVANALAVNLNLNVDIWLAGFLMGAVDSSLFSAAWRLSLQLSLVVFAMQVAFSPAISRLWHRGDHRRLEQVLRAGSTVGVAGLGLVLLPILIAPEPIMQLLFGQPFGAGAQFLVILSIGAAASAIGGLCSTALMMSDNEGVQAATFAVAALVRCLVGGLLFALWGPIGIAISSATVTLAINIATGLLLTKRMGLYGWPTVRPRLRILRDTQA